MKALILVNGKRPGKELLDRHLGDADLVLAVDGAAGLLRQYAIRADALVGDLDSAAPEDLAYVERENIPVIRLQREKDDTDTMHALDEAISRGADEVVLLGAIGSRFDHSFANALLLVRALKKNINARIEEEQNILFAADGKVSLHGKKGNYVSILPLTAGTVANASRGLKYPLNMLSLPLDNPLGVSNEMTQPEAGFEIACGLALVALARD